MRRIISLITSLSAWPTVVNYSGIFYMLLLVDAVGTVRISSLFLVVGNSVYVDDCVFLVSHFAVHIK